MLPYSHRLPTLSVKEVFRNGHRLALPPLQLIYKPTEAKRQFAVIIPGRINKRAVVRNRQRRLIMESIRLLLPNIKPVEGVFLLQRPLVVDSIAEVKTMVEGLLIKAGVY